MIVRLLLFAIIGIPLLLGSALFLDTWLKQVILRCYAAPWSVRQRNRYLLGCTLVVAILLQGSVIPGIILVFFPNALREYTATTWLLATGSWLGFGLWGSLLGYWWRKYGDRCPSNPQHHVPGPYRFGRRCPHCDAALTPWLENRNLSVVQSD
jgi:hypothetical protein